jgi:hypothetical protein
MTDESDIRNAALEEGAWRPIETAPIDERFLASVDGEVRIVQFGKTSHVPIYGWCLADQGAEDFDLCSPTHWMPLPKPPEPVPAPKPFTFADPAAQLQHERHRAESKGRKRE